MAVVVYTARVTYTGTDGVDITRKGATGHAVAFAPSWRIVTPILSLRRAGRLLEAERAWPGYVEAYTAEMRNSYRGNWPAWAWLLERPEVTLLCYCSDPQRCHRTVLAWILGKMCADVRGERDILEQADRSALRVLR